MELEIMTNKLTEVNKLKAYTRNEFDANGDIIYLTIKFNKELAELLKKACANSLPEIEDNFIVGENEEGETQRFNFQRYKAKAIFYRELGRNTSAKNILYAIELLNNGLIKIPFYSVYKESEFLNEFQTDLKRLSELLIGENLEREISFNLSEIKAE